MSVIEETQLRGTLTAIDEINDSGGINGRPIEPIIYDPGSDSRNYGLLAKKLMVEDGCSTERGFISWGRTTSIRANPIASCGS
ncbi:transporter substrate-binding protein [Roseibium aggregatum]|uniref:transporter substrate-binding protein n=1 Tax=Roseibium aggregatum TaxID=187304 RepID=UPI001E2A9B69